MHLTQHSVRSVSQVWVRVVVISTMVQGSLTPLLFPTPSHPMQESHQSHHFSCIHHYCSTFTFIMLHRCSSYIQCSFHIFHPSHLWLSSQPHIRLYYSLHQPVFLHSLHTSRPHQHTLLCSTSQVSRNTCSPSHLLISHSIHTYYSTHTP